MEETCCNESTGVKEPASTNPYVDTERAKQMVSAGITKSYAYHKPSEQSLSKITEMRRAFSVIDFMLNDLCPPSRERSVAITKLEECAMWGIKAVVLNDAESTPEV